MREMNEEERAAFFKRIALVNAMLNIIKKAFAEQKPYQTLTNGRIELKFCIN